MVVTMRPMLGVSRRTTPDKQTSTLAESHTADVLTVIMILDMHRDCRSVVFRQGGGINHHNAGGIGWGHGGEK